MRRMGGSLMIWVALSLVAAMPMVTAQEDQCLVAPDGLVAWWPGDGNADDVIDSNPGTLRNGATFAPGKVGLAFSLDGVDDYVEILDPPDGSLDFGSTDDYSLLAWAKTVNNTSTNPILAKGDTFASYWTRFESGKIRSVLDYGPPSSGSPFDSVTSPLTHNDGDWHHVAVVADRDTALYLYVDGLLVAQDSSILGGDISNGFPLEIGRLSLSQFMDGQVDEVAIANDVLSASQILAIFEAGSAGMCKDEDGDGFRPPEDCDETNASINPDGLELPGNFVDENCDGDLGDCSPCTAWRNHGEYIRCTSQAVNLLVGGGVLTEEEGDALVSSAARSDVGKRGYVSPECPQP